VKLKLFGNISKVNENDDGTLTVSGIASSESVDSDGEIILADAIKNSIPDYMKFGALREMHQNIAAGTTLSLKVSDDGKTEIQALVVDPVSCKKVLSGTLKGFSIGGKVLKRNATKRNIIESLKLTEISLVDRPANPDAMIALYKADEAEKSLYCIADLASVLNHAKYVQRNALIDNENSPIPQELSEWIGEGLEILNQMTQEELSPLMSQPTEEEMPENNEVIEEVKKETEKAMKPEEKKEEAKKEEESPKEESPKEDPKPSEDEMMMKEMYGFVKAMYEKMCGTEEKQKAESSDDLSKAASENAILKDELEKAHKAIEHLKNAENKGFTKAITIEKTEDGVVSKSDDGKPKSTLDLIKSIHSNGGKRFGY
jgi:phage head maturation protease